MGGSSGAHYPSRFLYHDLCSLVAAAMAKGDKKKGRKSQEPCSRDHTIHLHKYLHGIQFKKRAPRAIREIRKFTGKVMGTKDIRIDTKLNKYIWSNGIRN